MKDVKEKIVAKALELFNERGIEYVGMRELAAALGIRIGNITYYFPTKDDLVFHLAWQYQQLNSETYKSFLVTDISSFFARFIQIFSNQEQYRCLLLSFVHIMEHNKLVSTHYGVVVTERRLAHELSLLKLVENRFLKMEAEEIQTIVAMINLYSRFWLSEAILSGNRRERLKNQIAPYLFNLIGLLKPYATGKGLKQIIQFQQGKMFVV